MSKIFAVLLLAISASALHYGVQNGTGGTYCLIFDSDIGGTVSYNDTVKNTTVAYKFKVPSTAPTNFSGHCWPKADQNITTEALTVHFIPNDIPILATEANNLWSIELVFGSTNDTTTFKIVDYKLRAFFYPSNFNSSTLGNETVYRPTSGADFEWHASENNGFSCSSAALSLTNGSVLNYDNLKVVAFTNQLKPEFPNEQVFEQCKADMRTSDLVPIIVGACLAGLVIIVLVAYLIGRARAKRQGYASV